LVVSQENCKAVSTSDDQNHIDQLSVTTSLPHFTGCPLRKPRSSVCRSCGNSSFWGSKDSTIWGLIVSLAALPVLTIFGAAPLLGEGCSPLRIAGRLIRGLLPFPLLPLLLLPSPVDIVHHESTARSGCSAPSFAPSFLASLSLFSPLSLLSLALCFLLLPDIPGQLLLCKSRFYTPVLHFTTFLCSSFNVCSLGLKSGSNIEGIIIAARHPGQLLLI
jgi:hypothetical protein